MSKMMILSPLEIAALADVNGNIGVSLLNAKTPDPKEVVVASKDAGTAIVRLDLGSEQTIDSLFLGYTRNLTFQWGTGTSPTAMTGRAIPLAASATANPLRQHALARLAAPIVARYIDVVLFKTDINRDGTVGIFSAGLAFEPTWNREWGGGRQVLDTGSKEPLISGGFGLERGTRKASYRWTFGDLSDGETEALYSIALDRGETAPVVVVEDPDNTPGLNERIHYGLFDRFEAYERQAPGKTRWSLAMTQWV